MGFTPPPHSEPCAPPRRAAARAPALFGRGTLRYNTLEVHVEHAPKKPKMGEDDCDGRAFSSHVMEIRSVLRPEEERHLKLLQDYKGEASF